MTIAPEFVSPTPDAEPPVMTIEVVAERLEVEPVQVRQWLSLFNWERRYDAAGHLWLSARDAEFLQLIKSLRDVDRSCASIARLIGIGSDVGPLRLQVEAEEPGPEEHAPDEDAPEEVEEEPGDAGSSDLAQIETLKAELRDLHARPAKRPFWKFWERR